MRRNYRPKQVKAVNEPADVIQGYTLSDWVKAYARSHAKKFVKSSGTPFDPSKSYWDAKGWGITRFMLLQKNDCKPIPGIDEYFNLYQDTLVSESKMLQTT